MKWVNVLCVQVRHDFHVWFKMLFLFSLVQTSDPKETLPLDFSPPSPRRVHRAEPFPGLQAPVSGLLLW